MEKKELLERIEDLEQKHGSWSYDIPLPFDIWTKGNQKIPHTRLKRIVQIVSDSVGKPLSECRILDLGCLDGIFSIEFAQQGAETIGIEVREDNFKKAILCKEALNLNNLEFLQQDARKISIESHGMFDAIICSGLLYHLTPADAIDLVSRMHSMSNKVVVIDTHIALKPETKYVDNSGEYWGNYYEEHRKNDSQEVKSKRLWASWDNNESYLFSRPSLVNILNKTGFTSVYECFTPAHINNGKPGIEHLNRCTFVALKGKKCILTTSPSANDFKEDWPENTLDYSPNKGKKKRTLFTKVKSKLKKLIK